MESVRVYEPLCVIDNIDKGGTLGKINCVETCGSQLFLGTREGILLEYIIITDESLGYKYQLVRQCNLNKNSKQSFPITFVRVASVLNVLIILQGNVLSLYDIQSFEKKGNTISGVNCISIDENSGCDPFVLELCITKKSTLILVQVSEKGFTTLREISLESTPESIAVSQSLVCTGLSNGKYLNVNIKMKKQSQELCSFDPSEVKPLVVHFAKEEYLVIGPGGLGVFVTAKGTSERPPISWPGRVLNLAVDGINIVCIGEDFIYVHSVIDYMSCNIEKFPGAKNVSICEGKLYVWTSSRLYLFRPVSVQQQINTLLESEDIEKAFSLVQLAHLNQDVKSTLMKRIHSLAIFKYISQLEFESAKESFYQSGVDLREILKLFPGILPSTSNFSSNLSHNFSNFREMMENDEEKMNLLVNFIVGLLLNDTTRTFSSKDLATSLLKLSSKLELENYQNIILKLSIMDVDHADLIDWLKEQNSLNQLAYFLKARGDLAQALDIWIELSSTEFDILQIVLESLVECRDKEIVSFYFEKLHKIDPAVGLEIYKRKPAGDVIFLPLEIAETLHKYPKLCIEYIEDCVENKKIEDGELHTYLVTIYIDQILTNSNESLRPKLRKFIIFSNQLKINYLIGKLKGTPLRFELALLHGKAGDHKPALQVLTKELNDHSLAREYCLGISEPAERQKAFTELIRIYVDSKTDEDMSNCIILLQEFCQEFNLMSVLQFIPDEWSLQEFKNLLTCAVRGSLHKKRITELRKSLLTRVHIDLHEELHEMNQGYAIETSEQVDCDNCRKRLELEDGFFLKNEKYLLHRECL